MLGRHRGQIEAIFGGKSKQVTIGIIAFQVAEASQHFHVGKFRLITSLGEVGEMQVWRPDQAARFLKDGSIPEVDESRIATTSTCTTVLGSFISSDCSADTGLQARKKVVWLPCWRLRATLSQRSISFLQRIPGDVRPGEPGFLIVHRGYISIRSIGRLWAALPEASDARMVHSEPHRETFALRLGKRANISLVP